MATQQEQILWTPMKIGSLEIAGRVFKAATSETRATDEGFVTDELLEFYTPIAEGGTPLIITGNICVSKQGHSSGRQASIDHDDKIPGLRRWVEAVQRPGVRLFAQLNHGGRQVVRPNAGNNHVVSASDVQEPLLGTKPRALRRDEIPGLIDSFAASAVRAQTAGFSGVELHFAHGYLISQFLAPHTNRRNDEYGGSLRNRMRLPLEILAAVRERVGSDFPIIAKINGTDSLRFRKGATEQELLEFGMALASEGLDAIEISRAHYESFPPMMSGSYKNWTKTQVHHGVGRKFSPARQRFALAVAPMMDALSEWAAPKGEGYNLPFAQEFRRRLGIPVITNGGFATRPAMEAAILAEQTDAVSCARAIISNPYLYKQLYQPSAEAPACLYCNMCVARVGVHPVDCYDPEMAKRKRLANTPPRFFQLAAWCPPVFGGHHFKPLAEDLPCQANAAPIPNLSRPRSSRSVPSPAPRLPAWP